MTKNYLPITEPGTVRTRTKRVEMSNQFGAVPYIIWHEEDQILLADGTYKYAQGGIISTLADEAALAESFPLINPDTGEVQGQMTGEALLTAIQSYYVFKAQQRDAQEQGQTP